MQIQAGEAGSGELFPYIKKNILLFSFLLPANENEMLLFSALCSVIPSVPTLSSLLPWLISNHEEVCGLVCLYLAQKMLFFPLLLPLPLSVQCFLRFICKPVNTE